MKKKWLDLKDNDNFKVYDVTIWFKTNCNTDNYFKLISTEFNQYCSIQNGSIFQMQFKFDKSRLHQQLIWCNFSNLEKCYLKQQCLYDWLALF